MSGHTLGKWEREGTTVYALEQCGFYRGEPQYRNRFDAQVQGAFCPQEEKEKIARLIAAAPELLEALDLMVRSSYEVSTEIDPRGHRWSEVYLDQALVHARAAIAKATGQ